MSRILSTDHLVLASHNAGKLSEMQELFLPYNFRLSSISDYGLGEPIEDGKTFEENAYKKASVAAKQTGEVVLSDDSGICIESLGNAPGIYTANWAETPDSDTRDFSLAMRRVEEELQFARCVDSRNSQGVFLCGIVSVLAGRRSRIFPWRGLWSNCQSPPRRIRFRLRSDIPTRWSHSHFW